MNHNHELFLPGNKISRAFFLLLFLFQINTITAQPYLLDGHRCDAQGGNTEWGAPVLIDGDDGEAGTSEIRDVWTAIVEDTLWFALSRESGGTATWVVFLDADCNPGTGPQDSINEPYRYGAEIGLGFKWAANSPAITGELFLWNPNAPPNGKYISASNLNQIGLQGELICGDNTTNGWFGEFFILIEDLTPLGFDPCNECGGVRIPGFASLAGGDPNSATKDEAFPDATEAEIVLQYNVSPVASFSVSETVSCLGDSITLNAMGSTDTFPNNDVLSISWDFSYDGIQFNAEDTNQVVNVLYATPGSYDIALVVTDLFECSDTLVQSVAVFESPVATCSVDQDVSCFGGDDGAASVFTTGGTGPFQIQWSNGQTGSTAAGLTAGMHSVIVTDANLCQSDTCYIEIVEPAELQVQFSGQCVDEAFNLVDLNAIVSGGTTPYAYQWSNGVTSASLSGVPAGTYSLVVIDALGCTDTLSITQECCRLELQCGDPVAGVFNCLQDIPGIPSPLTDGDPGNDSSALEALGIMISSSCDQITASIIDVSNNGAGCVDDTLEINRLITITDGISSVVCTLTYLVVDTLSPAFDVAPESLVVPCTENLDSLYADWLVQNAGATGSDQCGGQVFWNHSQTGITPDFSQDSLIGVWFYIADNCGNTDSAFATFSVSCLNVFKIAGDAVPAASEIQGNYDITFTFILINSGSTSLTDITLEEDLVTQLGGAFVSTTTPIVQNIQTDGLLPFLNPAYDGGVLEDQIFSGGGLLTPGQSISLDLIAEIDPDAPGAVYNAFGNLENQASGTAEDPEGNIVEDASDDTDAPLDIDMASDDDDPTPFDLPAIGVAKFASIVEPGLLPGQFTVTYGFVLQNLGNVALNQITMVDDLVSQFGPAFVQSIPPVISNVTGFNGATAPIPNPLYDGGVISDSLFLSGSGGILPVGGGVSFELTIVLAPNVPGAPSPLLNQATASGTDPDGETVTDTSDDGIDPEGTNPGSQGDMGTPDDPTITDIPVVIFCPQDLVLDCSQSIDTLITGSAVAFGSCSQGTAIELTFSDDISGLNQCNGIAGQIIRTWIATDLCGNADTCKQILHIEDTTPPEIISCPQSVVLECGDTSVLNAPLVTDNCDPDALITMSDDSTGFDGTCSAGIVGEITRTFVITDACGNTVSCSQIITVQDLTSPEFVSCPADTTILCNTASGTDALGQPDVFDACGYEVSVIATDDSTGFTGTCSGQILGQITRTFTVGDVCGNISTCIQVITVEDNVSPEIMFCPPDTIVDCTSETDTDILGDITVLDNCSDQIFTGSADITSGFDGTCSSNITGAITRTFFAEDACGNVSTCVQIISLQDTESPVITTCPENITVECFTDMSIDALGNIAATDNCSDQILMDYSDASTGFDGTCNNNVLGTIERTFYAEDICGNVTTCVQIITVQDTEAPAITSCPGDTIVDCTMETGTDVLGNILTTDNCMGEVRMSSTDVSTGFDGSCIANVIGTIERTFFAEDACGSVSTCRQIITVQDTVAPAINSCPADTIVDCTADITVSALGNIFAEDNCSGEITTDFTDIISGFDGTCDANILGTIRRTFLAADACGNTSTCVQVISVQDTVSPEITFCPTDTIVDCTADVSIVALGDISSSDNCGNPASSDFIDVSYGFDGTCETSVLGTIERTFFAEDACGNVSTCLQIITVQDTLSPEISSCPPDTIVDCTADISLVALGDMVVADNCSGQIIKSSIDDSTGFDGTCNGNIVGIIERTFYAEDACGNISTCIQLITVQDTVAPDLAFDHPLLAGLQNGGTLEYECFGQDLNWTLPDIDSSDILIVDNCSELFDITFEDTLVAEGECAQDGYFLRYKCTWTVSDPCGNTSELFFYLEIIDTTPPVLAGVPSDTTVSCAAIPAVAEVQASDACLCAHIEFEETVVDAQSCVDGQVLVRTWTATDHCGNVTVATQRIQLVDETGPQVALNVEEFGAIQNGDILQFDCNTGGFPLWFMTLKADAITISDACQSSSSIQTSMHKAHDVPLNCHWEGYLEEILYIWTVEDACGNESTFTVRGRVVDTIPPVIENIEPEICGYPAQDQVFAIDDCSSSSMHYFEKEIERPCGKAILRTYEAVDACGNIQIAEQIIYPQNGTGPVLSFIHPDLEGLQNSDTIHLQCTSTGDIISGFSVDDVESHSDCEMTLDVEFSETIIKQGDCSSNNPLYTLELQWIATDQCGNINDIVIHAIVDDNEAPEFLDFREQLTVSCGEEIPEVQVIDACSDVEVEIHDISTPGACAGEEIIQRHITAMDLCGNISERVQVITMVDDQGPEFPEGAAFICNDTSAMEIVAWDRCSDMAVQARLLQESIIETGCDEGYMIQRIWEAEDACGNVNEFKQQIRMDDTIAPVLELREYRIREFVDAGIITLSHSSSADMDLLNLLHEDAFFAIDACEGDIALHFEMDIQSLNCADNGFEYREYTWTAMDICGNTTTEKISIQVVDDVSPSIFQMPADTVIMCGVAPAIDTPEVYDLSGSIALSFTEVIVGTDYGTLIERNWTAKDDCGNTSQASQNIEIWEGNDFTCSIVLPQPVACNSHDNILWVQTSGGQGPYTYTWKVVSGTCLLSPGQSPDTMHFYHGFTDVVLGVEVTDVFGCMTYCEIKIECDSKSKQAGIAGNSSILINISPAGPTMAAYPNPVQDRLNLELNSYVDEVGKITIVNELGQYVFTTSVDVFPGIQTLELPMANLANGMYVVLYRSMSAQHAIQVMKQDK